MISIFFFLGWDQMVVLFWYMVVVHHSISIIKKFLSNFIISFIIFSLLRGVFRLLLTSFHWTDCLLMDETLWWSDNIGFWVRDFLLLANFFSCFGIISIIIITGMRIIAKYLTTHANKCLIRRVDMHMEYPISNDLRDLNLNSFLHIFYKRFAFIDFWVIIQQYSFIGSSLIFFELFFLNVPISPITLKK